MTGKTAISLRIIRLMLLISFLITGSSLSAETDDNKPADNRSDYSLETEDPSYNTLMLSGRIEMIEYASAYKPIREKTDDKSRFYFNNIYINLEGYLYNSINYIVEFQALTSDLYLFGGIPYR